MPGSSDSIKLLAHELVHTVQQQGVLNNEALQRDDGAGEAGNSPQYIGSSRGSGVDSSNPGTSLTLTEISDYGVVCHCDPSTETNYDEKTFHFISSIAPFIKGAAKRRGIPPHAVAGAIADEYSTQRGIKGLVDRIQDALIGSFPEWQIDINRFFDTHSKLTNTLENDIGPANIKVRTALGLVQAGELEVPGQPFTDKKVSKIVQYLLTEQGTVETTAAVITKAENLLGSYLHDHSKELYEAILVEYFKQGDSYYDRFSKEVAANPKHKICPGTGGCTFWHNYDRINEALFGACP